MVPANAAPGPMLAWATTDLTVSGYGGTTIDAQVEFTYSGTIRNPGVKVTGQFPDTISVDLANAQETSPGHAVASLHVEMPAIQAAPYVDNLQLTVDGQSMPQPLHLTVATKAIDPNVIPDSTGFPSASRITTLEGGATVIADQMVVSIATEDPSPDETIKTIAAKVGAQVVSSVSRLRRYEIRVPGSDFTAITSLLPQVKGFQGVTSATIDMLAQGSMYTNDEVWLPSPGAHTDENWNLQEIDAPSAWDVSKGNGVDVAEIDSGVYRAHPDLSGRVKFDAEVYGSAIKHGTHTSGTVCAQGSNYLGTAGVAWGCNLSMYGVYTKGNGKINTTDIFHRVEEIIALPATKDGTTASGVTSPKVVNISLGIETDFNCQNTMLTQEQFYELGAMGPLGAAMATLVRERPDILWVFAAGNSGYDSSCSAWGGLGHDSSLTNVVSVAASEQSGELRGSSVRGSGVTVAAPGSNIYSTLPPNCSLSWLTHTCDNAKYGKLSGTSMAAPHVTGTAALALAAAPSLKAADVKECLVSGAKAGGKQIPGQSLYIINARKTVDCAVAKAHPSNNVESFTTNGSSAFALRSDGQYWAWGDNTSGQLGAGTSAAMNSLPAPIPNLTDVKSLVTGRATTFAVMKDGSVLAWGDNSHGLLGDNSTTNANTPQAVPGLADVRSIAVNESDDPSMGFGDSPGLPGNTVFAVKNDGTVWAWGDNPSGVLGNGTTTKSFVPVQVLGLGGVTTVASEGGTAWALKSNGSVESWGDNADGQLGIGAAGNAPSLTPQPVEISNVTSIQAGYHALVALKNDGTVWAWGMAGNGLVHGTTNQPAPQQKASLSGITKISVQRFTGVAIKNDGTAWGWGSNANGEAGVGLAGSYVGGTWANNNIATPLQMPNLSNVTDIQVGMALTADGTAWWWSQGGSGPGLSTHPETPVQVISGAAGIKRVLSTRWALKSDGTLWGWGNAYDLFGGGGYLPRQIIG